MTGNLARPGRVGSERAGAAATQPRRAQLCLGGIAQAQRGQVRSQSLNRRPRHRVFALRLEGFRKSVSNRARWGRCWRIPPWRGHRLDR